MMGETQREAKLRELDELRSRATVLESELAGEKPRPWRATGFYTAYYATTGFMLGMFGAISSLLFNIIGSTLFGKHPLELIRVYLTFPLGARALELQGGVNDGIVLTVGCCLYIATGMLLGMLFQLVLVRFVPNASLAVRMVVASVLALAVWLVNFYAILVWLQPWLFGGSWIIDLVPWWVAMLTHLVFGWTMALVYPLGLYIPYQPPSEAHTP